MEEDANKENQEINEEVTENENNEEQKPENEKIEEQETEQQEVGQQEELKEPEKTETLKKEEEPKVVKTKKKKNKGLIIAIVLILIIIVAAVVGAFFIFGSTTIDLAECLNVEYEGEYSGYATATVEIDVKKLKNQLDDLNLAEKFIKKAKIEVENDDNLSNGDEITVKVNISSSFLEENKLKLKEEKVKLKVSGLDEPTKIDMSKYIKVEYDGFNNHATANVTLLTERLEEDLKYEIYSKLRNQITLTVLDNEELANGDKIKVQVEVSNTDYLEENGIKISDDVVEFEVEGLEDATEVDAFKDIEVSVTGMSPNLSVTVTNKSTDEFLRTVQYSVSKKSGIANGETVTITAERWDENLAKEKSVTIKETSMKYTISGQAAYIFSVAEIKDSVKAELKSTFISKATSKANENYSLYSDNAKNYLREYTDYKYIDVSYDEIDRDLTAGTPEVVAMYLLTKKENKNVDEINIITGIVKVPFKSAKADVTYNWYITVQASNASLKADETISDNTSYSITATNGDDEEKAYQSYVNNKKNNYDVERISL